MKIWILTEVTDSFDVNHLYVSHQKPSEAQIIDYLVESGVTENHSFAAKVLLSKEGEIVATVNGDDIKYTLTEERMI